MRRPFNILAIGQSGRLQYEAVLLVSSLRRHDPGFAGRLFIAEPQPGPLWPDDPRMTADARAALEALGATILPFQNRIWGAAYPNGNKIEALAALPDEPFLFLDTDTVVTGPLSEVAFDFARPSASMRRENTWPTEELYGPTQDQTWAALYDLFGLDFASSLDPAQPEGYWRRNLYFNAGWFFHESPQAFGKRFAQWATRIWTDPPEILALQPLTPWLDQIVLPLVIHSFGGGRPGSELSGLDGDLTCHWRMLPLFYARETDRAVQALEEAAAPNPVKKLLREYGPMKKMIYQGQGAQVRAMFDRAALPRREQAIRNAIKREGLWTR
ncbi:hypothetical protein QCN27_01915 [Cereibacter sp. SYSU M97828]|nr:hypothetical protein [Cereibacter flavus]